MEKPNPDKCACCKHSELYKVNKTVFVGTVKCVIDVESRGSFVLVPAAGTCKRFEKKSSDEL